MSANRMWYLLLCVWVGIAAVACSGSLSVSDTTLPQVTPSLRSTIGITQSPTATKAVTPLPLHTPTLQLVPTATPPPTVPSSATWLVDAARVDNWPLYAYQLTWATKHPIEGYSIIDGSLRLFGVDASTSNPIVVVQPVRPDQSSSDGYTVERQGHELILWRREGNEEIIRTVNFVKDCERLDDCLYWSPDGAAVSYLATTGEVWIWDADGTLPRVAGETHAGYGLWLSWSPDSTRLTVLDRLPDTSDYLTYSVVFRDGRDMIRTLAQITNRTEGPPSWATNNTVVVYGDCGAGCSVIEYFDALSGRSLGSAIGGTGLEGPSLSPDTRWLASQEAGEHYNYVLSDLNTGEQKVLADGIQFSLEYVGWSTDSAGLFAIKRQLDPTGTSTDVVSALVRYWPLTGNWNLVADNVIEAVLAPDATRFLAVSFGRSDEGRQPLALEVIGIEGKALSGRYQLGLEATNEQYDPMVPIVRWSQQDYKVLFVDPQSQIVAVDQSGGFEVLGRLSRPIGAGSAKVLWAPTGDRLLFVVSQYEAWIISP